MSRLLVTLLAVMGLAGCHTLQHPELLDHPPKTSHLRELLKGKGSGGPLIRSLNLGGGRVDTHLDDNSSDSIPGFIGVSGLRITEGNEKNVGITVVLSDSTSPEKKNSRTMTSVVMDSEEALRLEKVMQQEMDYVAQCIKNPPKHHEDMIWISAEGMSIEVSSDASSGAFFHIARSSGEPDSMYLSLSFSMESGRQLMAMVDNALDVANG